MKRLAMIVILWMCASCAANPNQDDQSACVSSCTEAEPEHPSECADACAAYDDATIATAFVKENCELTDPPPQQPAPWTCTAKCFGWLNGAYSANGLSTTLCGSSIGPDYPEPRYVEGRATNSSQTQARADSILVCTTTGRINWATTLYGVSLHPYTASLTNSGGPICVPYPYADPTVTCTQ